MMNNYQIIKEEEFQEYIKTPEGSTEIINKYKDQLIEVNIYVINEGITVHLRPPESIVSIKTYYILEGEVYCIPTKEICKAGSIILLKEENELLHINAVKKTRLLVQTVKDDAYTRTVSSFVDIYQTLVKIQKKDAYTHDHSIRVCDLVRLMASELDYKGQRLQNLVSAAKYHDIGKIYIDDTILNKPSQLTNEEFEIMKGHTVNGEDLILEHFNPETLEIIRQHHERIDGSGYPQGLKGEKILQEAKIIAICDTFDAMTTDRVYKKGKTIEVALDILRELAGVQYDKELVLLFSQVINKNPQIIKR